MIRVAQTIPVQVMNTNDCSLMIRTGIILVSSTCVSSIMNSIDDLDETTQKYPDTLLDFSVLGIRTNAHAPKAVIYWSIQYI